MSSAPKKPFPYVPTSPSERELVRMELMKNLNMWDNNDPAIAKRMAEILIELIKGQFELSDTTVESYRGNGVKLLP